MNIGRRSLLAMLLAPAAAIAQTGGRTVKIVVPFSAGGPTDIVARIIAQNMTESLGQPVIVENKAGANGAIAAAEVAQSAGDGHTILYNTAGLVIAPALAEKLPYSLSDFAPIALISTTPLALAVHPDFPGRDLKSALAYIKANPGKVTHAVGSMGATPHLAMEQLAAIHGLKVNHIQYKGAAPALADVAGGHVQMIVEPVNSLAPFVKDKRVRALAVFSETRAAVLPDLATYKETVGSPFEASSWTGMVVPASTPKAAILRLNAAVNKALMSESVIGRLAQLGSEPLGGSDERYGTFLQSEVVRWQKVVKEARLK